MVLEPSVWPFDLAFGLRGEGIDGLNATIEHDLFPLGIDVIGEAKVPGVELIPTSHEAEDRVTVNVVGVRIAIAQDEPLQGVNVHPDTFVLYQLSEEEESAEVIEGRDEVPFDLCSRSPEVMGGVMLDQLSDVAS